MPPQSFIHSIWERGQELWKDAENYETAIETANDSFSLIILTEY